jgi:hypothetical protein
MEKIFKHNQRIAEYGVGLMTKCIPKNVLCCSFFYCISIGVIVVNVSGCVDSVEGSGEPASQMVDISGIRSMSVSSAGTLRIVIGEYESLSITGDDNILEIIEVNREGDHLSIEPTIADVFLKPQVPLVYEVQLQSLEDLTVSGQMQVELTGLYVEEFTLTSSGLLEIYVEGQVQAMHLVQTGVSKLAAEELMIGTLDVNLTGSTVVDISVSDAINGRLAGLSKLTYHGGPALNVDTLDQSTLAIAQPTRVLP